MIRKIKPYLPFVLSISILLTVSWVFQTIVLTNKDPFVAWLEGFGPLIILIYVIIQSITIIIPPLGGTFIYVALIAILGPTKGLIIVYFVITPLYIVNFLLARKYGRPFVKRLVGETTMSKIDHYSKDLGTFGLVILRVFQGAIFDYLSYAAGLTTIPFKTFALVNIFGGIPALLVAYFILTQVENFTIAITVMIITAGFFTAASIAITHLVKKHKLRNKD